MYLINAVRANIFEVKKRLKSMHMSEEMWCHEIPLPHYEDINNSIGICDFMKQPETSRSVCHKILFLKCRNTFKDA